MNRLVKSVRYHRNKVNGFTLIELLIVVIILGILAAIVTIGVAGARNKSIEKSCKQSALNLATALDEFYLDNGTYPDYTASGWVSVAGTISLTTPKSYMKSTPVIVGSGGEHDYWLKVTGTTTTEPTVTGYSNNAGDALAAITGCVYPNT